MKNHQYSPLVSVIMPVYNSEKFVAEAINSILVQTFTNFEFIIIDDGSTDNSYAIIKSFADKRIQVYHNEENCGLVYCLNKGVSIARGKYIARMDADDISMPRRLEKQVAYLEAHPECSVLATYIDIIDEDSRPKLPWFTERAARTPEEIFQIMVHENCIAHSTVVLRTADLPQPAYLRVHLAEDWDLWLRILRKGPVIHKLTESLVKYRVHKSSITQNSSMSGRGHIRRFYLGYLYRALRTLQFDRAARAYIRKLLFFPVRLGKAAGKKFLFLVMISYFRLARWIGKWLSRPVVKRVAIAAPWLNVGGADQVVIELANGLSSNYETLIILTEKSTNPWLQRITPQCKHLEISKFNSVTARVLKFTHVLLSYRVDILLISNSAIAYSSLPLIKKCNTALKVIDVLHAQGSAHEMGGFPQYSAAFRHLIDHRITVSLYMKNYLQEYYGEYPDRITTIYNGIKPPVKKRVNNQKIFHIVWVGRLAEEKNPALALRAFARLPRSFRNSSQLTVVGDGPLRRELEREALALDILDKTKFTGFVQNGTDYISIANCLLVTSEMEGLPIVIIEAIHCNTPVIATSVGGIPELIKNGINGYLVPFDFNTPKNIANSIIKVYKWNKNHSRACNKWLAKKLTTESMISQYNDIIEYMSYKYNPPL